MYDRARGVVRELGPLLHTIRKHDKSLAEQLKRAAQSVVLNIARWICSKSDLSCLRTTGSTSRSPPAARSAFC